MSWRCLSQRAVSNGKLVPFRDAELGLRLAAPGGGGALLEATGGYTAAELFQAATATQCFRFLDSQVDFEDHEVGWGGVFTCTRLYTHSIHLGCAGTQGLRWDPAGR